MQILKFIGYFIGAFLFWAIVFIIMGFIFLENAPCSWFGSSFEGACGYAAFYVTLISGFILTLVFSLISSVLLMRRPNRAT